MSTIKPTIGRRVWFWPSTNNGSSDFAYNDATQPCDAGIAYVHSDRMLNVSVADQNGVMHSKTSVPLLQEGDARPSGGYFCEWMPYQQGQAKKHEVETKVYSDGASVTGTAPLPDKSPAQQGAADEGNAPD